MNKIKLYRFERFEKQRLESIKSKSLWFSSPNKFNDLNDCHFYFDKVSDDIFLKKDLYSAASILYKNINELSEYPVRKKVLMLLTGKNELLTMPEGETTIEKIGDVLFKTINNFGSNFVEELIKDDIKKTTGVCCFFGVAPENQLMWAHYANNHQGFCTEYTMDTSINSPSNGLHGVNYSTEWPLRINEKELIFSPASTINRIVSTKGIDWAHEKEYRFIRYDMFDKSEKKSGKTIDLPKGLKACRIIAGARVNKKNLDELERLANDLEFDFTKLSRHSFSSKV